VNTDLINHNPKISVGKRSRIGEFWSLNLGIQRKNSNFKRTENFVENTQLAASENDYMH